MTSEQSPERIIGVAIWHGGAVVWRPKPARHADLFRLLPQGKASGNEGQGFITSTGRFVNRKEAHVIAWNAKQVVRRCGGDDNELYSENVW